MSTEMILLTAGGSFLFLFVVIYLLIHIIYHHAVSLDQIRLEKERRSRRKIGNHSIDGIRNVQYAYENALCALEEAPKDPRLRRYLLEIGRKAIDLGIISEKHLSQDFYVICGMRLPGTKSAKG